MVQIAQAWAINNATGEQYLVPASNVDKSRDAKTEYFCPDKCCRTPLSHFRQHLQTYIDPTSREAFKISIAAHFQRKPHAPAHAKECTAVDDYTKYQLYARAQGGVSHQRGAFVFNLNIPTDNSLAPLRQRVSALSQHFRDRALIRIAAGDISVGSKPAPQSEGLSTVEKLAGLLDVSGFDTQYRSSILLRDGPRLLTLAEIYKDEPIAFYRQEHKRARDEGTPTPVLVHFKPIALAKYQSSKTLTIQGLASPVSALDRNMKYSVSVLLHCGNQELFKDLKDNIRDGARSFLVYAPSATVDLMELMQKKRDIAMGCSKDNAVFVHVRVERADQIMEWSPRNLQAELALSAGIVERAAPVAPRHQ